MKDTRQDRVVSDLCYEIDVLKERLTSSEEQVKYWRELCAKTQNESIDHSQTMLDNLLKAYLEKMTNS